MKKNNKLKLYALLLALIVVLASCSGSPSKEGVEQENIKLISNEEQPYIGFLIDTLKEERWYKDKSLFEEEVKNLGGQVKTLAANGIDNVQISQAELLIEEGVDVLVVVPHDATISAQIVEMAHKSGVKVISYDRLIKNADVDYYISFDNEKVGELQATEVLKKKKTGNFVYIGGSASDNNATLLRQGTMNVLQPLIDKGDVKLVFDEFTSEWKPEVAKNNMQKALNKNGKKIDAVIAANDGTAGGVIELLSSVGLAGKVPVSGQDAELEGVRRVVQGLQTMTVYKSVNSITTNSAEMAITLAKGQKIETDKTVNNGKMDVPSVLLDPIAVTKDNVRETIIKDGYLLEKDVYQ